jgi:hypothetical protein
MPLFGSSMKVLRTDLVGASSDFLSFADFHVGITEIEAAIIPKMIFAQIKLPDPMFAMSGNSENICSH